MQTLSESQLNHATTHFQHDSIYLHDSIHVSIRPAIPASSHGDGRNGNYDTLYIERWHTRWREKVELRTDTLWREQVHTETVQVRYVPVFYKYCAIALVLILLYCLVRLAIWLYRRFCLK